MSESPLASLRVIDLTDLRGAMAARILADLGAPVTPDREPEAARRHGWKAHSPP